MKKILLTSIVLGLFTLTACGGEEVPEIVEEPAETAPQEQETLSAREALQAYVDERGAGIAAGFEARDMTDYATVTVAADDAILIAITLEDEFVETMAVTLDFLLATLEEEIAAVMPIFSEEAANIESDLDIDNFHFTIEFRIFSQETLAWQNIYTNENMGEFMTDLSFLDNIAPDVEEEEEEDEEDASTTEAIDPSDVRNIANFWVELDGERFFVGQSVADIEASSFAMRESQRDILDETLAARTVTSMTFERQNAEGRLITLTIGIINVNNEEIPMRDAFVSVISLDDISTRNLNDHEFFAGVTIGESTKEEVLALFGEPDDQLDFINTTLMYQTADWGGFSGSAMEFTFVGPESSNVLGEGVLTAVRIVSYVVE